MRIQKATSEVQHEVPKSKKPGNAKPDIADPFAKILEEKRKGAMPQFGSLAEHQELPFFARTGPPQASQNSGAPADIQQLAAEIADHISSYQAANGSRAVEVQFNSQTLEGLRVYVSSQQGAVAVNFVAPAARIAGLVQKNLGELRASLESKGIRLAQMRVSRRPE